MAGIISSKIVQPSPTGVTPAQSSLMGVPSAQAFDPPKKPVMIDTNTSNVGIVSNPQSTTASQTYGKGNWTQGQLNSMFSDALKGGATDKDIYSWAQQNGVGNDQIASAWGAFSGTNVTGKDVSNYVIGHGLDYAHAPANDAGNFDPSGVPVMVTGGTSGAGNIGGNSNLPGTGVGGPVSGGIAGTGSGYTYNPITSPTANQVTPAKNTQIGGVTQWEVTPEQTAAGLINQYTDPNSPIIQLAMTRAQQDASARGLQNSSLAATAGQSAAYDAALPLAEQDAGTYAKAGAYNADESNQFALKQADLSEQTALANLQSQTQLSVADLQSRTQTGIANAQNETSLQSTSMNNATSMANTASNNATSRQNTLDQLKNQIDLANIDNASKLQLQQMTDEVNIKTNTSNAATNLINQTLANIGNIQSNTNMDESTKATAIANQLDTARQGLKLLSQTSGIPDLDQLLNFNVGAPTPTPAPSPTPTTSGNGSDHSGGAQQTGGSGGN